MGNPKFGYAEVDALLSYDIASGNLIWKPRSREAFKSQRAFSTWTSKHAGKAAFKLDKDGYRRGQLLGRGCAAHRLAWLLHYGEWPSLSIDHIDGDRDNNRIENLRLATPAENSANRAGQNKTSTYKGVCYCPRGNVWRASVVKDGKQVFHQVFRDEVEAARAYDTAALAHFGRFARANFGGNQ